MKTAGVYMCVPQLGYAYNAGNYVQHAHCNLGNTGSCVQWQPYVCKTVATDNQP